MHNTCGFNTLADAPGCCTSSLRRRLAEGRDFCSGAAHPLASSVNYRAAKSLEKAPYPIHIKRLLPLDVHRRAPVAPMTNLVVSSPLPSCSYLLRSLSFRIVSTGIRETRRKYFSVSAQFCSAGLVHTGGSDSFLSLSIPLAVLERLPSMDLSSICCTECKSIPVSCPPTT